MKVRRVLILADESADWMVAGLRQLERLALSIDECAVDNNETSPVGVRFSGGPTSTNLNAGSRPILD
jgi:hypothetical protein